MTITVLRKCAAAGALTLAVAGPSAVLAVAGPSAALASSPARSVTTVSSHHTKLGLTLADGRGRTLYTFTGRRCYGRCAARWVPLLAGSRIVAAPRSGVNAKLFGRVPRGNGRYQVTYAHHPLYLFSADRKAGQSGGEGAHEFGGYWYVLGTRGNVIKPKRSSAPLCGGLICGY
ncbi:MAG: COG4315 family predicted lipoprotein [Solirubrobacteraceae bacterium]